MDIKQLKKLYEEYKKIGQPKNYDKGGSVKSEHNESNLQELKKTFDKFIQEEGKEKGYDEGGNVTPDSNQPLDKDSVMDSIRKAFNISASAPTPAPKSNLNDKYEKIRQHNRDAMNNNVDSYGQVQGYADGGDVQPDEDRPGLTPEQFAQHVKDLQNQGLQVDNDDEKPSYINASLDKKDTEPSADLADVEDKEDVDKKSVEAPYDSEEAEADLKSDDSKKDDKDPENDDDLIEANKSASDADEKLQHAKRSMASDDPEEFDGDEPEDVKPKVTSSPQDELKEAQRERNRNIAEQQIEKGAARFGAGLSRTDPSQIINQISQNDKYVDLPVEDYTAKVANQVNDPNSPVSKVVGQYLQNKGFNLPPGTSASAAFKVMPFLQKDQALQSAIQKVTIQQQNANARNSNSVDAANQRAKEKNAIEQQKADAMKQKAIEGQGLKQQAGQDRALAQTKTMLESARGNPAAAQAEKDMYSVDKVNSLFKLYPDPNKIPEAQVNLVVGEIAKVAQGGVPPGHEMDALKPGTAESRLQNLWGKVVNSPQPANLGAYLNELKKYTDALHGDAQKVIKDKYGRVIESSKKQLGDENYNALKDQYLSRFDKEDAKTHPQDSKAIEWAKSNPRDPKAAQILKINGIE